MKTISVKILSYRSPQRYAIRRIIDSAFQMLLKTHPDVNIDFHEVKEVSEILKITPVLILPSLVVENELVCNGRFPKKEEVLKWLEVAM